MQTYHVTWDIHVSARSPKDAARKALEIQRDGKSTADVFTVCYLRCKKSSKTRKPIEEYIVKTIDLSETRAQ